MKKIKRAIFLAVVGISILSLFLQPITAELLDDLGYMADELTRCKGAAQDERWEKAQQHYDNALARWGGIKPRLKEDESEVGRNRIDRILEVDKELENIKNSINETSIQNLTTHVNRCIWAISYQPDGFKAPEDNFTLSDWILALVIGLGFDVFAIAFGLHLRRIYRRGGYKGG